MTPCATNHDIAAAFTLAPPQITDLLRFVTCEPGPQVGARQTPTETRANGHGVEVDVGNVRLRQFCTISGPD